MAKIEVNISVSWLVTVLITIILAGGGGYLLGNHQGKTTQRKVDSIAYDKVVTQLNKAKACSAPISNQPANSGSFFTQDELDNFKDCVYGGE